MRRDRPTDLGVSAHRDTSRSSSAVSAVIHQYRQILDHPIEREKGLVSLRTRRALHSHLTPIGHRFASSLSSINSEARAPLESPSGSGPVCWPARLQEHCRGRGDAALSRGDPQRVRSAASRGSWSCPGRPGRALADLEAAPLVARARPAASAQVVVLVAREGGRDALGAQVGRAASPAVHLKMVPRRVR